MSECVLYHGDCLEVMPRLESGSVDMCFADLPYAVTKNHWDVALPLPTFFSLLWDCCKKTSAFVATGNLRFSLQLITTAHKDYRYDLVWKKTMPCGFLLAKKRPLQSHEHVLVFYRKLGIYNPQKTFNGQARMRCPNKTKSPTYGGFVSDKERRWDDGTRFPTSVLAVNENDTIHRQYAKHKRHPTQKPVALLEWLIKTYTNEGDTVLDPVFGSNTTAIACARLGRNYIGIEKDAEYFRIGAERVNKERRALGLSEAVVHE